MNQPCEGEGRLMRGEPLLPFSGPSKSLPYFPAGRRTFPCLAKNFPCSAAQGIHPVSDCYHVSFSALDHAETAESADLPY